MNTKTPKHTSIIVVIPCYNEDQLIRSLESFANCHTPTSNVEVIVVINGSVKTPPIIQAQNLQTFQEAQKWATQQNQGWIQFTILRYPNLPPKHAGVGLARKIGMDMAAERLEEAGNPKGIIACFDADSQCDANYFQALEAHFGQYPKTQACSIHFEHPIEGKEFSLEIYQAIIQYELHLRYYIEAQKWTGFPFAFQTIGSSMAVRADVYRKQGGMNRRKAGEDFYFLHKFTPLGNFTELNTTRVIPSPRISERVPFGTGKAVGDLLEGKNGNSSPIYYTYHPQSFVDLKVFFDQLEDFYQANKQQFPKLMEKLPKSIFDFLIQINFQQKLQEIRSNTSNYAKFYNRFFRWFNAFMLMKYVHFARDHHYSNLKIVDAAKWLLEEKSIAIEGKEARGLLLIFREKAYI